MIDWTRFLISLSEVFAIAWLLYYGLCSIWNQRVSDVVTGTFLFSLSFVVAHWLDLIVLQTLLNQLFKLGPFILAVIFQPEIRLALAKLGSRDQKYKEVTEFDTFVEGLSQSIYRLGEKRYGGLVLIENNDSLSEYASKAVHIGASFSPELLESIFIPTTPLHDGAVIVRGTHILSAATILPLADDSSQVTKSMGTRHRAALGISQRTDALVIVISEETGRVSVAIDGIMTRGVKIDRFRSILRSVFSHPHIKRKRFSWN